MKRLLICVFIFTFGGLVVVYGEVESVKMGYRITQLNQKKISLIHEVKRLEYEIANLKTPSRLENWMQTSRLKFSQPRRLLLAKVPSPQAPSAPETLKPTTLLARVFLGTANADSR